MLVAALVGFLVRLVVGIALALVLALLLAALRDDGSFSESFRVAVWGIGALMLLMAGGGQFSQSPGWQKAWSEAVVPWFPRLAPYMAQGSATTRVNPNALFVLTALTLFGIGIALG